MQFTPGRSLGPYEIVSVLGEGGMGTVYRAHDGRLGRDVAVKVLRAELLGDEDHQKRFLQEARAASALNHPAIVTVHDIGTQDGAVYIVMELVDGRPLDQVLPRGGFPVAQLLRIGMQIADACAVAHAHQIIHRDLKPANVMLQPDGRVRILDFGLAKMIEEPVASDGRTVTRTGVGTIVGTIAYMDEASLGWRLVVRAYHVEEGAPPGRLHRCEIDRTGGARRAVDAHDNSKFVEARGVRVIRFHCDLLGLDVRSLDMVLEFQPVRVGKKVPRTRDGSPGFGCDEPFGPP